MPGQPAEQMHHDGIGRPAAAESGAGGARAEAQRPPSVPAFLSDGGEMGRLIRAHDWAATPLGVPSGWPVPLRTAVRLMLTSHHPMLVFWGPQHIGLYNDAFRQSLGPEKHPAILGRPAQAAWPETWALVGPQLEQVIAGHGATWHENQRLPMRRHGALQEVYWTYGYSPIDDAAADSGVGGVLVLCTETTPQMLAQRGLAEGEARWRAWFENAPGFVCVLSGPEHRCDFANRRFRQLVGRADLIGHPLAQVLPGLATQGFLQWLDAAYRDGEPFAGSAIALRLEDGTDGTDGTEQRRHVDLALQPTRDASGAVNGVLVQGTDVTDRVLAAAALADSEARYRALAEQLPGGAVFVVDRELRFVMAAGVALADAGFAAADLLGRTVADVMEPALAREAQALYRGAFEGRSFEIEHAGSNGRFFLTRGGPLRGAQGQAFGALAVSIDITSRRAAEDRLRDAQAQLDSVMAAAETGVWSWDLQHDVIEHDPNLARLYGLPVDRVCTPQEHFAHIHADDHAALQAAIETALQEGALDIREYRVVDAQGATRWLAGRGRVLYDGAGRPERMTGLVIDITELKQLEESLRRSDRQKDEFLAVLAHELRNPLAPLLSATRVLQQDALAPAEQARCRDIIGRQVQQMALLLDDLLDVSRIKHGRLRLNRAPVVLADVVGAAVETATPLIDGRGHRLQVMLPAQPLVLDADAGRMAQVLANLLGNAAKYTERGGRIELTAEPHGAMVAITVRDNGIGLSTADQARVFSMFTQIERGRAHAQGGLGIGLALVKGLVGLHGGQVQVHSAGPGQGSAFTVSVPALGPPGGPSEGPAARTAPGTSDARQVVMSDASSDATPSTSSEPRPTPTSLPLPMSDTPTDTPTDTMTPAAPGRWRVLVADDNADAAETLAMFLRMHGHEVHVVADGLQAVDAQARLRPDVALVDIGMPGLNGYEVAQRVRALQPGELAAAAPTLLVALTGWGQEGDKQKAREAGFDLHFTKPVDPTELLRQLAPRLGRGGPGPAR